MSTETNGDKSSETEDLQEDGVTNPKDGRGILRPTDDQADALPKSPTPLKAG